MPGEADPALLADAAVSRGYRLALPHVTDRDTAMRFLTWSPGDDIMIGPLGLRQPRADAPELTPAIILTPLVAFDAALNRLGQGGGFYDRAARSYPSALRIGVAWSIQQRDTLPVDAWDMPLHAVITEHGWIGPENE